ncbi:MAG TPA: GntR family transcriptional regulator [Candidatus Lumbricidophila sp.]|nr:GntR family transcriptional regulator [Candidatus Lumbricidophila sp.]
MVASADEIAADLGVAQGTAAKAYRLLEQDGLVTTRTGAGTRVAASAALLPRTIITRIRDLVDDGSTAGANLDDVISVLRAMWPTNHTS